MNTTARVWMLEAWFALRGGSTSANQWVRKAGPSAMASASIACGRGQPSSSSSERVHGWTSEIRETTSRTASRGTAGLTLTPC
jgi:hypothetical protein